MQAKATVHLAMLYGGKTAGIVVAFFFLPLYSAVLGPEQFGMVAVILSLQALLVSLDLGMSTLLSRDIAMGSGVSARLLGLLGSAERVLTGLYAAGLAAALLASAAGLLPFIDHVTAAATLVLFWILVLQNLYYYALLARHRYTGASMLQMAGVTARACFTAVVLLEVEASVRAFVAAQLAVAVVHGLLARRICRADLLRDRQAAMQPAVPHDALSLVKRAAPLALASLAGAAVTQLDKPLIAAFMSSASVVPYFLATTICMTPISLLAAPVAQYCQPRLMRAMSMADTQAVRRLLARFTLTLVSVVGVPGLCLWLLAAPAVNLWLGAGTLADSVARYVSILLPGFILGGLGFVPYSLVLAAEDFRFQARLSVVLTAATLLAAAFFAFRQSLTGICVVYVIYYAAATIATWLRATQLPETRELASFSSHRAITSGTVLVAAAGITAFIFR